MIVWGLTGNIACGKSAVEAILRARGIPVIDADQVARQVVEPGEPALELIRSRFGDAVLTPSGALDRKALGDIVFADPQSRRDLEAITHPRIFAAMAAEIAELAAEGHALAVVSAALMVESGSYRNYAGLAVVTCPEPLQLARLRARDGSSEQAALARIRSQLAQAEKAAKADVVIDNGASLERTEAQVDAWLTDLQAAPPSADC